MPSCNDKHYNRITFTTQDTQSPSLPTSKVNVFPSGPPMNPISSLSTAKEEVRKRGRGSTPRGKHQTASHWSSRTNSTLRGKMCRDSHTMDIRCCTLANSPLKLSCNVHIPSGPTARVALFIIIRGSGSTVPLIGFVHNLNHLHEAPPHTIIVLRA